MLRKYLVRILLLAIVIAVAIKHEEIEDRLTNRSPGEKLYRKLCADCHGLDARGNTPQYMGNAYADLRDNTWRAGADPESWGVVIKQGVFGSMPAHPELHDAEVRLLVDYLLKLRGETRGRS